MLNCDAFFPCFVSFLLPFTQFLMLARIDYAGSALCRLRATLLVLPHCDLRCPVDMMGCKSVEETDVNRAQCTHVAARREIHGLIHPAGIYSWEMGSAGVTGGLTRATIPPTAYRIRNTCVFGFQGIENYIDRTHSTHGVPLRPEKTQLCNIFGGTRKASTHSPRSWCWNFDVFELRGIRFSIFWLLSTDAFWASLTNFLVEIRHIVI